MSIDTDNKNLKKDYQRTLGDSAQVSVAKLEQNPAADQHLLMVGTDLAPPQFEHLGSAAFHVYAKPSALVHTTNHAAVICQIKLEGLNEQLAQFALMEFSKRLMAAYAGKERTSIDPGYKVEQ